MSGRVDSGSGLTAEREQEIREARRVARRPQAPRGAPDYLITDEDVGGFLSSLDRLRADQERLERLLHAEITLSSQRRDEAFNLGVALDATVKRAEEAERALDEWRAVSGAATGSDQRGRQPE